MSVPCVWALTDMSKTFCSFGAFGCVFAMSLIKCTDKCWCSAFSLQGVGVSSPLMRAIESKSMGGVLRACKPAHTHQRCVHLPVLERHGNEQLLGCGQEHGVAATVLAALQWRARAFEQGEGDRHQTLSGCCQCDDVEFEGVRSPPEDVAGELRGGIMGECTH